MSKRLRICLLLGVVLFAVLSATLLAHRSSSRKALQEYKAQLRAQGEKLTYAEFAASRAHTTNSSLAAITNASKELGKYWFYPGTFEFLQFAKPGRVRVAWKEKQPRTSSSPAGGPVTWKEITEEIDSANEELERLRQAMKDPVADLGFRTNIFDGPAPFVAIRSAAQWLAGSAIVELHRGNLEAALNNIEALIGVARLNRDEPTLVGQMIRVAVAGLGSATTWQALQADGWSESQLERLQSDWERTDLLGGLERAFVGERIGGQEVFIAVRQPHNPQVRTMFGTRPKTRTPGDVFSDYVFLPVYKLMSVDDDELLHLKTMQAAVESARSLKAHRPWQEVKAETDKTFARIGQVAGSLQRYRYMFSMLAIPNYQKATLTCARNETQRQMAVAAIALKRYQLHHGKPASSLEALVPEFLPNVPWDALSGQPLHYQLNADGTFLLYSVGEDGHDDDGDPRPPQAGKAADLWSGRDAVWPRAAEGDSR